MFQEVGLLSIGLNIETNWSVSGRARSPLWVERTEARGEGYKMSLERKTEAR